jgi:hypothetical protein
METVKTTVKSELNHGLKSWSEVVKRNTSQVQNNLLTTTKKSVKQVMDKVNEEQRRANNLMIYGHPKVDGEDIGTAAEAVYKSMSIPTPMTIDCYIVGKKQDGKTRPIRVECQNRVDVEFALLHSKRHKGSENHSKVYLSPDRSEKQRLAHSLLVKRERT